MKKVLLVLLVLFVVGIAGIVMMCQKMSSSLKEPVDAFLVACSEERWADAFAMTSRDFKRLQTESTMRAYLEPRLKAAGPYKGLGSIKGFEIKRGTSDPYDDAITVDVEFERATFPGKFLFQTEDGEHRFYGITLDVPSEMLPKADLGAIETTARELVDLFADGQLVALYDRFHPGLKHAWPAEEYQSQLSGLRAALGPLGEVTLDGIEDVESAQRVSLTAKFQNGTKPVRIRLVEHLDRWIPMGFYIGDPPPESTAETEGAGAAEKGEAEKGDK